MLNYGIVYSNNTQPFDVAMCIVYGIPFLFETPEEAAVFAKKKGLKSFRIETKDVIMRHVKYVIEYFSGYRIPVVKNGKLVGFTFNKSCKSFDEVYPLIVQLAKGDLKEIRKLKKPIERVKFKRN